MSRSHRLPAAVSLSIAMALMSSSEILLAAERPVIEEVLVTAQKREQSIRDVPISLLALDSEFLSERGVTDFSELSNFVPNVKMRTDVGGGVNLNIRGFSKQSGNTAFDQAVGLLVDGVPYNDNDFFVTGMVDLARIEVLRGPQGTLLGKNTTAGLINMTTARPTDELSGFIELQSGEYSQERVEAALSGPIIADKLNGRLTVLSDKRDGVMRNTTADTEEDSRAFWPGARRDLLTRDRSGYRLKLEAPELLGATWGLQYEFSEVRADGNATEVSQMDEVTADYFRQFDPKFDTAPNNYITSVADPAFSEREVKKLVLFTEFDLGEGAIKATFGKANVAGLVATGSPTPAPMYAFQIHTDKPQTNLDIVYTSPSWFDDKLDLTAGFFYERRRLKTHSQLDLNTEIYAGVIAANNPNVPIAPPDPAQLLPIDLPIDLTGPINQALLESSSIDFIQRTKTYAFYGQTAWHFAERWTATLGLRVSEEKKSAAWKRVFNTTNRVLLEQILNYEEFEQEQDRSEMSVQPKLAINYKPTEEISLFLHVARGYRSGGYNQAAARNAGLEYDSEVVTEYAFNAKTRLLEGALELNFGAYVMELEDFQLLTTGPDDLAAVATNAGSARSQGVELDFRWLPNHWMSVSAAAAYNDAEFIEFPFGPCPADRRNFDGDDDERCDLSGADLPNSPLWSASLNLGAKIPLADFGLEGPLAAVDLLAGLAVEYQTQSTTGLPGDSRFTQEEYARWDAHLGVATERWTLRLSGKNLGNEIVNRGIGYIPSTDDLVQSVEAPRTMYAQFRVHY